MSITRSSRSARFVWFLVLAAIGSALVAGRPASAADLQAEKIATSLKFIPATASSYSAMLRNREIFDNVANSKAWKTFSELEFVQKAWNSIQDQIDAPLGEAEKFFDDPLNQDLLKMLIDMVSDEIYVYSDEKMPQWLKMYQAMNAARLGALIDATLGDHNEDKSMSQFREMLRTLDSQVDKVSMFHSVVGFRLKDANKARVQIKRLDLLVGFLPALLPDFAQRIAHETVGGVDYLTLTMDGSMVPWDSYPIELFEEKEGEFKPLIEKLKAIKFVVAIGVRENFMTLSLGTGVKAMEKFDNGPKLAALPEFQKLIPFEGRRTVSVGYDSGPFRDAAASSDTQMKAMLQSLDKAGGFKLPEEITKLLKQKEGKPARPSVQIAVFADHGFDSYRFDWSGHENLDSSKRLTALDHLGGNPLAFVLARTRTDGTDYVAISEVVKFLHNYLESNWLPELDDDAKEEYKKVLQSVAPLFKRIDGIAKEKLLPALKDGQTGFVLDAQITSKQWIAGTPQAMRLPMLEFGLLVGHTDRVKLEQAGGELRDATNDFLSQLDQFETPLQFFRIPAPKQRDIDGGKHSVFRLPEDWGLDEQIAPTTALSDKMLIVSTSTKQAERMLKAAPPKLPGVLADTQRPLASAVYLNFSGTVDAMSPWVELATREALDSHILDLIFPGFMVDENAIRRIVPQADDPPEVKAVLEQMQTVLDILKCFRSYGSVTYLDKDVWVTRGESMYQDLP